jgi:hypothetical protein
MDFELVLSVAPLFRVNPSRARESVTTTEQSVRRWREVAMKLNISRAEVESMAPAFRFG